MSIWFILYILVLVHSVYIGGFKYDGEKWKETYMIAAWLSLGPVSVIWIFS